MEENRFKPSRTYEKLPCKGEPYRFSSWRDPSVQTDRQTEIQLLYIIRIKSNKRSLRLCFLLRQIVKILWFKKTKYFFEFNRMFFLQSRDKIEKYKLIIKFTFIASTILFTFLSARQLVRNTKGKMLFSRLLIEIGCWFFLLQPLIDAVIFVKLNLKGIN